jgi:HPt (histidine-containing phosphotransfer) domain-containing protein
MNNTFEPDQQESSASNEVIFDYAGTLERLMEDEEFVRTIVDSFVEHFDGQLTLLTKAFSARDAEMVKRHAHSIKGASINAGALAINKLVGTIETLAEKGQLEAVDSLISQLPEQFGMFKEAFNSAL